LGTNAADFFEMLLTTENDMLMKKIALFVAQDLNKENRPEKEAKRLPAQSLHVCRPSNAYIIFAREWRKTLANTYPAERA
jgi:hypothetical protein